MVQLYDSQIRQILIVVAIIVLAMSAYQRNGVWITKLDLWMDVVSKTPAKSRVHNSLGNCYMLLGNHFKAVEEYKIALTLDAANVEVYYNMAVNLEKIGFEYEAYQYYDYFCRLDSPDRPEAVKESCLRAGQLASELNLSGK